MSSSGINIVVIGTGYVGLVTGACLAEIGHNVTCVDRDLAKIRVLEQGGIPIYEPGLKEVVERNVSEDRLKFSTSLHLDGVDIVFLAVGTPTDPKTDNADMNMFFAAAEEVKSKQYAKLVVVSKSTVPVGTGTKLKQIFDDSADIVSNPEFLREGSAVKDFMHPDRVVIGSDSGSAKLLMDRVYAPLKADIFHTSIETSELIKYASNSFLATKVAFINEMADLCEAAGADVSELADGMGLDKRIGRQFLNAGPGIGGSCFPKDTKSLRAQFIENGVESKIVSSVIESNEHRKKDLAERIFKKVGAKAKVAVFGLTFKANTDDTRESAAIDICNYLFEKGLVVSAYDPKAHVYGLHAGIPVCKSAEDAARGASAVIILTEWQEFKDIEYGSLPVEKKVIFDLRMLLKDNPPEGFEYFVVGKNLPA